MTGARKPTSSRTKTTPRSTSSSLVNLPRAPVRVPSAAPINETIRLATEAELAGLNFVPAPDDPLDDAGHDLPAGGQRAMRRDELVDLVIARTGLRRRDATPAVETALAVLGEALNDGRDLNLRPLGLLEVQRITRSEDGWVLKTRIRQPISDEDSGNDPLAHAAE